VMCGGGIVVGVAQLLAQDADAVWSQPIDEWKREWGVEDCDPALPGSLVQGQPAPSARTIHLIQRKRTGLGKGLGRTTGWVHRAAVRMKNVQQIAGAQYDRIDDQGLHITG